MATNEPLRLPYDLELEQLCSLPAVSDHSLVLPLWLLASLELIGLK